MSAGNWGFGFFGPRVFSPSAVLFVGAGGVQEQDPAHFTYGAASGLLTVPNVHSRVPGDTVNSDRMGVGALAANTTGANNLALGKDALAANGSGFNNIAAGRLSLTANTTGNANVGIGVQALTANTTGGTNVGIGSAALAANTTGTNNVGIGFQTLLANTTGSAQVALGVSALTACATGTQNTAVGHQALQAVVSGFNNVGIGYQALAAVTGSNNTGVGVDAGGLTLTSGTGNVLLGSTADTAAAGTSNGVALGYQAVCADNEFALGPNLTSMNLQGAVWPRRHPGRARLTANATNGTTSFSSLSDLSLTLVAGRNYCGRLALRCSDSTAAEGLKVDFNGGTATMTAFNAGLTGNVQGATAGTTVSAALAAALNLTAMNGTGDHWLVFDVSLTVNAGGTFTPRFAQNSHSTGTATAAAGSYLWLEDSPN